MSNLIITVVAVSIIIVASLNVVGLVIALDGLKRSLRNEICVIFWVIGTILELGGQVTGLVNSTPGIALTVAGLVLIEGCSLLGFDCTR